MIAVTRTFKLDIGMPGQQEVQYARKGDMRVYCFLISLQDWTVPVPVPSDASVMLVAAKPDGTMVTLPGSPESDGVKVYLSAQALTAPGVVKCQLTILGKEGSVLFSPRFDLVVEDVDIPEDALSSSSDFSALAQIVQNLRGAVERVSCSIIGIPYPSVEALAQAVPNPYPYSMYAVGTGDPYEIYRHTGDTGVGYLGWVSHGFLRGPVGARYVPSISPEGVLSWTNDGGYPNPDPINLIGPEGLPGQDGVVTGPGKEYFDELKAVISLFEDGVDFGGRYIDNAKFR